MIYVCLPMELCLLYYCSYLKRWQFFPNHHWGVCTLGHSRTAPLPLTASSLLWTSLSSFSPYGQTIYPQTHVSNIYFIFNYVFGWEWGCVQECWYPQRSEELDPAGVTGGCESPFVAAGNWSWVLCTCLTAEPSLRFLSSTLHLTGDDNPASGIHLFRGRGIQRNGTPSEGNYENFTQGSLTHVMTTN